MRTQQKKDTHTHTLEKFFKNTFQICLGGEICQYLQMIYTYVREPTGKWFIGTTWDLYNIEFFKSTAKSRMEELHLDKEYLQKT